MGGKPSRGSSKDNRLRSNKVKTRNRSSSSAKKGKK